MLKSVLERTTNKLKMEEKYVFDAETKELTTNGKVEPCLPGGIGKIIYEKMSYYAEKGFTAQIEAETGHEDSFSDFLSKCTKLAIYMKQIGIKPNDVISICSPNNLSNAVPFISSIFIGAICASTDPILSLEDSTYLLKMTQPKVIFVSEECIELIQKATNSFTNNCKLIVLQEHDNYDNLPMIFNKFTDQCQDLKIFEPIFVEDTSKTACILFSSGTTGLPKGTCLSHDYFSSNWFSNNEFKDLFVSCTGQDLVLGFTTLYWLSAVIITLTSCYYGLKRLTCRRFNAESIWDMVQNYNVKKLLMSYYHCMEAVETLKTPQPNIHQLIIAGGQIPPEKQDKYGKMLPNGEIITGYGMTEIGGVTVNHNYRNRSSGKPIHKQQIIKIVDPDTEQVLDLNKVGEIRIKCKYQMNGYYKKNSEDCWDAEGFFKTGDVGYLTEEFDLFVVDRIKEMFKYRGWHVIPAKIERHLVQHPCVQHCVVIGVPMATDDNHALAIVALTANSTANNEELLTFANNKMDDIHQLRAGVKIVAKEAIPYTITGKINRRLLKTHILEAHSFNKHF